MAIKEKTNNPYAKAKAIRVSPRKLNLVCGLIRGTSVDNALVQLDFSKKRIAKEVKNVLLSAVANADNNFGYDIDKLYISKILVGKSFVMKRFHARARGRVGK